MMTMLTADDRWAINDVVSRHGHVFDGGHLDQLDQVFTPDAVYDLSEAGVGTFTGIEAMRAGALRLGAMNPLAHHVTNIVVTGEAGDEVTVESKGFMIMADGAVASVNHVDTVRRHDGGWRIGRRVITAQRVPLGGAHLDGADVR